MMMPSPVSPADSDVDSEESSSEDESEQVTANEADTEDSITSEGESVNRASQSASSSAQIQNPENWIAVEGRAPDESITQP